MNVRQEDIAELLSHPHFILLVQSQLKIVAPVSAIESIIRDHGIGKEDPQSLEIAIDAIQHNNVWSNHQKVA